MKTWFLKTNVICLLVILLLAAGSLSGCGSGSASESEKKGLVIFVGGSLFDGTLDPIKGTMAYGYSFTNSALTKVDPDSEYIGDMAESWKVSSDALSYTFKLRKGVTFHDGSKFTAEDVVFTYNTVKKNQGNNESVDLSKLKSVQAKGDDTVVFTLKEPYSSFLDQTALLGIVPSDGYDSKKFDTKPVGTGPWKISQYDTDQKIIVESFGDYYEGAPEIPQVTMLNMDAETAIANAKSGELDVVMVESTYTKEAVDNMHIENLETMDVRQISLPVTKEKRYKTKDGKTIKAGNDVTSDRAVRKALSIGISRRAIIENALNGIGKPAEGFTSNLEWGNTASYKDDQKKEAIQLLEKAGWKKGDDGIYEKNGKKCQFTVISPASDTERYQLAAAVAAEAKKIGIQIDLEQKTWDEIPTLSSSNGVIWGWGQFDPVVLKNLFYSKDFTGDGMGNTVRYANKKTDSQIEDALKTSDHKKAINSWKKVQTETANDYAYLYIVNIEHSYFVNDSLDISIDTQIPHPHGHGAPIINNMKDWKMK